MGLQLRELNLSNNLMREVPNLEHLFIIANLDFSYNQIKKVKRLPEHPKGIMNFRRSISLKNNYILD